MIRGGTRFGHTARLLVCAVCAVCAVAIAAPATASAQPAVDEYSLDIPGAGGSEPVDPNDPGGAGAVASGSGSGGDDSTSVSGGAGTGDAGTEGGQGEGEGGRAGSGEDVKYDNFHKGEDGIGSTSEPLDTTSRSAPEVVADTLLDSAMLPVLAALVVITGIGAWRVLRSRGTLSRQAG
jgi:hypothetical protein